MIPPWILSVLNVKTVGDFYYKKECEISIKGALCNGLWSVSAYVKTPYFAWGVNNLSTDISGPFKNVAKYYLMLAVNQISEYDTPMRNDVLNVIKHDLE